MLCISVAFHQSVSSCAPSGRSLVLFHIHIDYTGVAFLQSASCCAFTGCLLLLFCIPIGCNGVDASPQCEWGSATSKDYFDWMTCRTVGNCIFWYHCGSACDSKGLVDLQMSSGTSHKISLWTSSNITSSPFWSPERIALNHIKINQSNWSLFLSEISEFWTQTPF